MATTLTILIFVSKLCHLTAGLHDPNLTEPTTTDPNNIPSPANVHFAQPNANERRPEIDSIFQNRHIMRDKRNVKRSEKNFIRLGRDGEEYSRIARADKNIIRFGRNENSKGNGFIRFGRSDKALIRLGRDDSEAMRFGRRGDKFIRFGRSYGGVDNVKFKDGSLATDNLGAVDNSLQPSRQNSRPGRNEKYIRFGRGENGFIRLGKKNEKFKYDQGMTTPDDSDSSDEKHEDAVVEDDDISVPLQLYLRDVLRKGKDLPLDIESNVAPGAPFDDDYLLNVKLNYDKNVLKNNLL